MLLAVITISDRCSRGEMTDTAGPAVAEILRRNWPNADVVAALLPDEEEAIAKLLNQFVEQDASLVLTAGGTGLGPRDRTPEATRRVIDREAPGLAEAMRSLGAVENKFAWLSRGLAGLKGSTLIVNLPGSKRAAEESITSILHLIKHGIEVAAGSQKHP
jgi:molybdenum cofactor synthesis domain-containing protein